MLALGVHPTAFALPTLSVGLLIATFLITHMRDETRAGLSLMALWAAGMIGTLLILRFLG